MLDGIKSRGIEKYLLSEYGGYFAGELKVDLNTSGKSCVLSAVLAGETAPVIVQLHKYEVLESGSDRLLKVHQISSDKDWLNRVLNDFIAGRQFKIPLFVAAAL